MFPSLPQPPSFSSTFLRLIDRHDCLLASSKCPRLVSLTLSRDSRDECGQSTIPWGNHSEQKHSSICQCKRTQGVLKRQRDVKDAVVWKIKIRGEKKKKSLCWNLKWRRAEYSMLVTFDSFNDFFAILCSVVRKVNCPMMIATSSGFVSHVLKTKEKKKKSEIPMPLHHWRVVETTPLQTLWTSQWFSRQMKGLSISDSDTETEFVVPLGEGPSTAAFFRGCWGLEGPVEDSR